MIRKLLEVCRKNLILFAVCNIFLGLAIGFGLGVYTLPILTAESGLDEVRDVPSWVEAIGIVIAGNMDSRKQPPRS